MSTTREKYILEGIINPAVCAYPGYPVRQTLIETGRLRPAPKDIPMAQLHREFLWRCTRNHMGREHKLDCKGGA